MHDVSFLGQSNLYHSLQLAQQDARKSAINNLLHYLVSDLNFHVPRHKKLLNIQLMRQLATETWFTDVGDYKYGKKYRCYIVITLTESDIHKIAIASGIRKVASQKTQAV